MSFLKKALSFFSLSAPSSNRIKGAKGEKLAVKYLQEKGFKVLAKNFRVKGGEADIIASYEKKTVVVEVKTRSNRKFGPPQTAVDRRKMKRLVLAGTVYCRMNKLPPNSLRVDVVAIELDEGSPSIRHLENVNI